MSTEISVSKKSKILTFFKDLFKSHDEGKIKQHYADTVVTNSFGEILLLQRSYNDDFQPGVWCLPGGKVDPGEDPVNSAPREVQEETGLDIGCHFIKTIEKDECTIHYFQGQISSDIELLLLDNEEHFRYEWVPFKNLDRYDLIFDLQEVLEGMQQHIESFVPLNLPEPELIQQMPVDYPATILKAFDNGLIEEDDFLVYLQLTSALENIKKGYEAGIITGEEYSNAFEKSQHYEFVNVTRDGKTFMQYRQVGTNKIEEHLPVGESVDTGDELGLYIKKYSDKSFLIGGDTYKNLELLRKIKQDAGVGNWNKALNGWIFPLSAKASILANLAGKMPVGTYTETIAKEAAIELKNALDVGTKITIDGKEAEIKEVTTNEAGKVEYSLFSSEAWGLPAEAEVPEVPEVVELSLAEKLVAAKKLGEAAFDKVILAPIHDKELMALSKDPYSEDGIKLMAAWNEGKQRASLMAGRESLKKPEPEIPIGTISPDGTQIKTADGWEHIKKDVKKVTETEIAIPPADDNKIGELINDATEINRVRIAKELFGKEAGEEPISAVIENNSSIPHEVFVKEFDSRSGKKVNALDYGFVKPIDILLVDPATVLEKPKPYWCPDINEKNFYGYKDQNFVFDYVMLGGDQVLLSLNGYGKKDITGLDKGAAKVKNEELKRDIANGTIDLNNMGNISHYGTSALGYSITINGKKYEYDANTREDRNDMEAIYNNQQSDYAVVNLDQMVAIQDYYTKRRKALIEKKKNEDTQRNIASILKWDEKKMAYYYPFDYERRLSVKQKAKYTKEKWDALPIEDKIQEVPFMKSPVVSLGKSHRIGQLDEDKMLSSNFAMYGEFVKADYMEKDYHKSEHWSKQGYFPTEPCYIEYDKVRKALQWKKLDMKIQREESTGTYDKALETSYGDINAQNDLMESHGVRIKLQNGKAMKADHIEQIGSNLSKVYQSFGDRSDMSKKFGLKISHSGEKLMFARKALGLYIPSMNAIGVSDSPKEGKFGFTLAHEFAHFMDNYVGKSQGRHFASEGYGSTASAIANVFRENMNSASDSDYMNRTCECFARALEQYHAMKHEGDDAIKYKSKGVPYHADENHPSKENFNSKVKPLIEQFLKENDHILKSGFSELQIMDINNGFELIKAQFDNDELGADLYLEYAEKYNEIIKGDPTHGGKLVKKTGTDSKGHKTTKWVKQGEGAGEEKDKALEFTDHSKDVLAVFAKEAPEAELKNIINTSHDEKLRKAAHLELDRRGKAEKVQDKKDNKPAVKKESAITVKKEDDTEVSYSPSEGLKELASKSTFDQFLKTLSAGASQYGLSNEKLAGLLDLKPNDPLGNIKKVKDYYYKEGKEARKNRKDEKKQREQEQTEKNVDAIIDLAMELSNKMDKKVSE